MGISNKRLLLFVALWKLKQKRSCFPQLRRRQNAVLNFNFFLRIQKQHKKHTIVYINDFVLTKNTPDNATRVLPLGVFSFLICALEPRFSDGAAFGDAIRLKAYFSTTKPLYPFAATT